MNLKLKISLILLAAALALFSCTKRKPEEPDYAPNSPYNPYPPDSATNVEHTTLDVTLSWTATDPNSGDVLTYGIYLDTLNPPLVQIVAGLTSPSYFLTGLSYNTTYYWNLYITDDQGVTTSGPVWRFTTLPHANSAPNVPTYLYPADNSSWQYPTLDFGWNCTDPEGNSDTLHYDLHLGATTSPSITLVNNDLTDSREITGLNYSTTYYWKVLVHDNHYAYTSGPLYSFSTRDCPWFYKSDMPSPRYGFGTTVVNDKIYVIGGTDGMNYLTEVLEYDPASDSWTRKTDMPTARSDLGVTAWNGKIYAIGGRSNEATFRTNEVYDPQLDSWACLALAPEPHYSITAHAVDGKILTFGGEPTLGLTWGGVFEYDIVANVWGNTSISIMPEYRYAVCTAIYNYDIYVFSGCPPSAYPSAKVDIYHTESNSWTAAAPMIGPANFSAAVSANGFIYVLGGYDQGFLRRVRKYDPVTDAWFIRGDMQDYRSSFGAVFVGNRIYAFGGVALLPTGTMEEYRIELDPKSFGR